MVLKEKLKIFSPYFFLLLAAILIFWQVSFFTMTFKWDMMSYYFPMRLFVSECLRSGNLPLWLPYQLCGLPIYGDPQSGAWYPVVWFLSIFNRYDLYAAAIEFTFTIFIAGAGFFTLAKGLKVSSPIAMTIAVCYMSSGFFIGHGQHLTLIISAAYLPFALHFYLNFLRTLSMKYSLLTALVLFLMFTGGYPGHLIVLFYFFLFLAGAALFKNSGKNFREFVRKFFFRHAVMLVALVLMLALPLLSYYQCMLAVTRGQPLSLEEIFVHGFTPQSSISFIFPFATRQHIDYFETDFSMSNGYFGIFSLICVFGFFFIPKNRLHYLLLASGTFFFLAALGASTPVREWLYHYIPMMNYFRYPSIFRIFFILSFLVLAAFSLDFWLVRLNENRKKIITVCLIFLSALLIIIAISVHRNYSVISIFSVFHNWNYFTEHGTIYDNIIVQAVILLLLVSLSILLVSVIRQRKSLLIGLCVLVVLDMFIASQLNMDFTVTSPTPGDVPKLIMEKVNKYPKAFPLPDSVTIGWHKDFGESLKPLYENLNVFGKQVHHEGYGPFLLNSYNALLSSKLSPGIFQNTYCFFADSILPYSSLNNSAFSSRSDVYVPDDEISVLGEYSNDDESRNLQVTSFEPNRVVIETHTRKKQLLVLMQNNFNGWNATVNEKDAKIFTVNYSLIGVALPEGKNIIEIDFKPKFLLTASAISITALIASISILLFGFRRNNFNNII